TTLAIWCAGRDKPRSQYGERAGTNRAHHMASGTGQTTFAKLGRAGSKFGFLRMMTDFVVCFPKAVYRRDWISQ
ncbi:unnamed protein product, partial [Brassica rapa]